VIPLPIADLNNQVGMGLLPFVTPQILASPVNIFEDLGDFDPFLGARRFKVKILKSRA
jgi:hypothetical protein